MGKAVRPGSPQYHEQANDAEMAELHTIVDSFRRECLRWLSKVWQRKSEAFLRQYSQSVDFMCELQDALSSDDDSAMVDLVRRDLKKLDSLLEGGEGDYILNEGVVRRTRLFAEVEKV